MAVFGGSSVDIRAKTAGRLWRATLEERKAPDTARRMKMRVERLSQKTTEDSRPTSLELVQRMSLERVIGRRDFADIVFLERALAVSRTVAFVRIARGGSGTGFMVSPRLMITNNHVLGSKSDAAGSELIFDFQLDRQGAPMATRRFTLLPEEFFATDVDLDFTLVAVSEKNKDGDLLSAYGWNKLYGEEGKAVKDDPVNIIQHPLGQPKQLVLRSNRVVALPDKTPYIHYETDTEPGSSGSPAYNDQWEVIALHHAGVPELDANDNPVRDDQGRVKWVANEGIRVSRLVGAITALSLTGKQKELRDQMLNAQPPDLLELAHSRLPGPVVPANPSGIVAPVPVGGAVSITIPLTITVSLGNPLAAQAPTVTSTTATAGATDGQPTAAATTTPPATVPGLAEALALLERNRDRPYFDEAADNAAKADYYRSIAPSVPADRLYDELAHLVTSTHKNKPKYKPARELYPWIDLIPGRDEPTVKSIYSGREFLASEVIREEVMLENRREALEAQSAQEATRPAERVAIEREIAHLEAQAPFNCEHVVPQSWFTKKEPMRGDLHHLFACESNCNSFRGNTPYFDFTEVEEALRDECGRRESGGAARIHGFEPEAGKGAAARATLYFLLRYPGKIEDREFDRERVEILVRWHAAEPPDLYEKHRNQAIFEVQGNRNPFIDHPDWAAKVDFSGGFKG
jgi:endonuclease I/V8-like Glu-specific endopeptidase